jgi:chorismate-pyruvate lyase
MIPTRAALALLSGLAALPARAETAWPDTYLGRVEATAVVQTLNARLLAARSATATLEGWCAAHGMAAEPRLSARLVRETDVPASPETRHRLQVGPDEPVRYRRVRLACGDHVLSEADNWYVPARLTPEMNRVLETTDTPFGRAVSALGTTRQTVGAEPHWQPLPEGWDQAAPPASACGALAVPERLFSHRAVLFTGERQPFSEVVETYRREVLDFARAARPADPACPKP